jgi:hypothetical protein
LAESTGLLAVNDEVLEVNGIEVNGKTLDQVMGCYFMTVIIRDKQNPWSGNHAVST